MISVGFRTQNVPPSSATVTLQEIRLECRKNGGMRHLQDLVGARFLRGRPFQYGVRFVVGVLVCGGALRSEKEKLTIFRLVFQFAYVLGAVAADRFEVLVVGGDFERADRLVALAHLQ